MSVVQGPVTIDSTSQNPTGTFSSAPQLGDTLIMAVAKRLEATFFQVNSITQSGVNWIWSNTGVYNANLGLEIWVGTVISSNANESFTVNLSAIPEEVLIMAYEFKGPATVNFLDQVAMNNNASGSPNIDTGTTPQTTTPNQLWVGAGCSQGYNYTLSAPTNGFNLSYFSGTGGYIGVIGFMWKTVNTTGQADAGCTISASDIWVACITTIVLQTIMPQTYGDGLTSYTC